MSKNREKFIKLSKEQIDRKFRKRKFRLCQITIPLLDFKIDKFKENLNGYFKNSDIEYNNNFEYSNKIINVECYSYSLYATAIERFGKLNLYLTYGKSDNNNSLYLSLVRDSGFYIKEFENIANIISNDLEFEEYFV